MGELENTKGLLQRIEVQAHFDSLRSFAIKRLVIRIEFDHSVLDTTGLVSAAQSLVRHLSRSERRYVGRLKIVSTGIPSSSAPSLKERSEVPKSLAAVSRDRYSSAKAIHLLFELSRLCAVQADEEPGVYPTGLDWLGA